MVKYNLLKIFKNSNLLIWLLKWFLEFPLDCSHSDKWPIQVFFNFKVVLVSIKIHNTGLCIRGWSAFSVHNSGTNLLIRLCSVSYATGRCNIPHYKECKTVFCVDCRLNKILYMEIQNTFICRSYSQKLASGSSLNTTFT